MDHRIIISGNSRICIGKDALRELNRVLNYSPGKRSALFVLADENTIRNCLPIANDQVKRIRDAELIEIKSGEENKTIETCTAIWRRLSGIGAGRDSILINLGGGVIGDMGGFAASAFKRGIRFINIPTTLLSQVDASVGGKLGIDLDNLKNEVGFFNEPTDVFICPQFLETLPAREKISGFAEVIKHALIADKNYWAELVSQFTNPLSARDWSPVIIRSIEIKSSIVKKDPLEKGIRKSLNFGHTIGHALESWSLEGVGIRLLHGEAIAIGMICEAYLSVLKCKFNKILLDEISSFILHIFKRVNLDAFDDVRLIELMRHDKKNKDGKINFTLISAIGEPKTDRNCDANEIRKALLYFRERSKLPA